MKGISYGVEVIVFVSVDMLFRHLNPLTSRQIEAERRAMTQYARRGGKIWVRLFPDKPVTVRPTESSYKRDSGKGSPEDWKGDFNSGAQNAYTNSIHYCGIGMWNQRKEIFTHLNVADNSGARELMCIQIIGASNRRYAHIGDVILAVIKEAVPNMPLERSEVIRAVIIRTCKELKRDNGLKIRYDEAAMLQLSLIKKEIQKEL
ncbi:unnamed protein product, partial [Ilex paraguariensis]